MDAQSPSLFRELVCGVNWIGDTIMSMPAIQLYRRAHPEVQLGLLIKPAVEPLWRMHRAPDRIHVLREGWPGSLQAVLDIRRMRYRRAYVLPHSFRSALIPYLAGIPERIGMPGHGRDFLLTRVVRPTITPQRIHQHFEYLDLFFDGQTTPSILTPELVVSTQARQKAKSLTATLPKSLVAILPGAARGPAKRWPPEKFAEVARRLAHEKGFGVVTLGGKDEHPACRAIIETVGERALDLAGQTTLEESAAVLSLVKLALANDSGGMHLASAVGAPVVAVFGVTNPAQTGPFGKCRIVLGPGSKSRDVSRDNATARESLEAITPEQVYDAALQALAGDFSPPIDIRQSTIGIRKSEIENQQ